MTNEERVHYLNFLVRTYRGVTKLIAATRQRLQSLPGEERNPEFDTLLKGENKMEGLETVQGRIKREIGKELAYWDIWELWLKHIPGIGEWISAELVVLFYYRFMPVCKECGGNLEKENGTFTCVLCGKTSKGAGLLTHKVERRDFPTISKWWAFMGRHTVDGVMPKRKSGTQSNWSTSGRTVGFHAGDQFNRQKDTHLYKEFMLGKKKKYQRTHPDWSKGHVHNAARNDTIKLFLSHFWKVARILEGKPLTEPYAGTIMGHTNIIEPFYFETVKTAITEENSNVQKDRKKGKGTPEVRRNSTSGDRNQNRIPIFTVQGVPEGDVRDARISQDDPAVQGKPGLCQIDV